VIANPVVETATGCERQRRLIAREQAGDRATDLTPECYSGQRPKIYAESPNIEHADLRSHQQRVLLDPARAAHRSPDYAVVAAEVHSDTKTIVFVTWREAAADLKAIQVRPVPVKTSFEYWTCPKLGRAQVKSVSARILIFILGLLP
jgi:hypothetical protein